MARISELINQMIQRMLESSEWTSANPTHTNTFIQANAVDNPDFEIEIKQLVSDSKPTQPSDNKNDLAKQVQEKKDIKSFSKKIDEFDKGQVGELQRMTTAQFGNVRALATNPVQFFMNSMLRKLAKGAGIAGFALIMFEVVKFIINELMKPGRLLDRRFKRDIEREIFAFRSREEKQKLRQGFTNIIVTTIGGLRGGSGQIVSSRGLVATGGIDRVINNSFMQPGTADISTGQDIKIRTGKPSRVFNG